MNTRFAASLVMLLVTAALASGCSHQLEVKNLRDYQDLLMSPLDRPLTIGVVTPAGDEASKRLMASVGTALRQYGATVRMPYSPGSPVKADVVASISVLSEYRGSGWNFLINWPGFLIFTPAWNGYVYKANYDFGIVLIKGADRSRIDSWSVPVNLNLRQAELDRTWTEVGWLEAGIIPLVGGIVFTRYDPDVTPILVDRIEVPVGEYIAQEIISRINSSRVFADIVPESGMPRTALPENGK